MKVAFVTPATFDQIRGGGERYPLNLARGLVRASRGEAEVDILSPAEMPSRRQVAEGVWLRGCALPGPAFTSYGAGVSWDLLGALRTVEVVHVHQVFTLLGEAAVIAARVFGRPVCVTDHGGRHSSVGMRLGLLDLADAVVAYSNFGASTLGTTSRPVIVIEGGIDTRFFSPTETDLPREHVVAAGRILPHKGLDLLLTSCPPELPVVIAGTPAEPDYLEELRRLASHRSVRFVLHPSDEELRDLYRRAFAVAAASLHVDGRGRYFAQPELMGMTMLEGMACGTPAVCMRTGGLPEYVEDGVTGFVVDDGAALGSRLAELSGDPSAVRRMGAEARRRVVTRWDIDVAGSRLQDLYRTLVSR